MAGLMGREALHTWTSPDDLTIVLNELDDSTTGDPVWPRYRIVAVNHGYPSAGDTFNKRVGQAGTIARRDFRGDRVHSYTIEVMGRTIDELREGEETLRAAFYDQSAEGRMDVNKHPLNPDYDADDNRYFNAKAITLDPPNEDDGMDLSPQLGFRREWVLGLRNHEGRYFQDVSTVASFKALAQSFPDLALYWALDTADAATDLSGNARDGSAQGGITIGGAAAPILAGGNSTHFDGSDDFIASSYQPYTGDQKTFFGIANLDSTLPAAPQLLAKVTGTSPYVGADLEAEDFKWRGSGSDNIWTDAWPSALRETFVRWFLTFDDTTNESYLYVNGVNLGVKTATTGWGTNGSMALGARPSSLLYFEGEMAHFGIIDRVVTAEEVRRFEAAATDGVIAYV